LPRYANEVKLGVTTPKRGATMAGLNGQNSIRFGWRMRLGMLLPSSNLVAEPEIPSMLPDGVSLHTTRLRLVGSTRPEILAMTEKVEEGAQLLADAAPDLIAFHCTAVSTFDAEIEVALKRRIEKATGKPATATSEALIAAFRALDARRIVLISPYTKDINEREVAYFAHHQITVLREIGLALKGGPEFAAVEPGAWYRLAIENRMPEADAYFLSCTTIRAVPIIATLERDLGKPVVTSNQALVWHSLRLGGVRDRFDGFGTLFQTH
jgi:maleate isomerase